MAVEEIVEDKEVPIVPEDQSVSQIFVSLLLTLPNHSVMIAAQG